jgi:hypothetical protein
MKILHFAVTVFLFFSSIFRYIPGAEMNIKRLLKHEGMCRESKHLGDALTHTTVL